MDNFVNMQLDSFMLNQMEDASMSQTLSCVINPDDFMIMNQAIKIDQQGVQNFVTGQRECAISLEMFEFEDQLGQGTSASVQKAIFKATRQPIAIKIIKVGDQDKRHQLYNELKSFRLLRTPYLIMFYGAFYDEGAVYLALEYTDCGSISTIMKILNQVKELRNNSPFIPEIIISKIVYQILLALIYMQQSKTIHRDIKPDNILISTNQYYNLKSAITENQTILAKLGDFGISKQLDETLTMCHSFVGTYTYMSPERLENKFYNYSSDIWSLGLVSYEMGTGQFPYSSNPLTIKQQIREREPPSLRNYQGFTPEFTDFIQRCLQKEPEKRSSAQELSKHPFIAKHNNGLEDKLFIQVWLQKYMEYKYKIQQENKNIQLESSLFKGMVGLNSNY